MSTTITCSRCHEQGHYAIDCTNNVSHNVTRRVITCGFCQEEGHNRRTCPSNRNVTIRKKKTWKRRVQKQYETEDHDCSICFEDCKKKGCELECGHRFHTKCIFTWLSKNDTCPLCRGEVKELKRIESLRLPSANIVYPITRLLEETINTEALTKREYSHAFYMMLKVRLESLSGNDYQEFLDVVDN